MANTSVKTRFVAVVVFLCFVTSSALAETCTKKTQELATYASEHMEKWSDVVDYYQKFRACDKNGASDGSSESIANMLVKNWDTLPQLGGEIKKNPKLLDFIVSHINSTLGDQLDKIKSLSSKSCPSGQEKVCATLNKAAQEASN